MPASPDVKDDFVWHLSVYYEDTDVSGVVYHANYLRFFERARTEWVRALGVDQDAMMRERHLAFTLADAQIKFRRPARLGDALAVSVSVRQRRRAQLVIDQAIWRADDPATVLVDATVRVACVNTNTFRPVALPPDLEHGALR